MFLPDFLKREPVVETASLPDFVEVRRSDRARKLALRLDTKKRNFALVVPRGVSMRRAEAFARNNQPWMEKRLAELPALVLFADGMDVDILGDRYRITVDYSLNHKRTDIHFDENVIRVRTNKAEPHGRVVRFLKRFAKDKLEALSISKAALIHKEIKSVTVRDTKSRWGSCSSDGKLSFSWRLIFAPPEAFDYVVAHEVAHLEHMDHSPNFWAQCEALCDDYKAGKSWMRTHAHELMRYQ